PLPWTLSVPGGLGSGGIAAVSVLERLRQPGREPGLVGHQERAGGPDKQRRQWVFFCRVRYGYAQGATVSFRIGQDLVDDLTYGKPIMDGGQRAGKAFTLSFRFVLVE